MDETDSWCMFSPDAHDDTTLTCMIIIPIVSKCVVEHAVLYL